MTPEEVWREAAAAACCAIKWKPSANRRGSAVIRAAMEAYAAEKVAEERAAIVAWLNGIGFGDEDQNRAKAEIRRAIAANQHHGGNDADT